MGIPALRKYIDATMHLSQCCLILLRLLFQKSFRGVFFLFADYRLLTQDDSVRQLAMRVTKEKKTMQTYAVRNNCHCCSDQYENVYKTTALE